MKYWRVVLLFTIYIVGHGQCKTIQVSNQPQLNNKDSSEYHAFYLEVMRSYCMESDSFYPSQEYMDSLLREENTSIFKEGLYWAPDSAFKVMVIEGEGCGAYCNPFWESRLVMSNRKQINSLSFTRIDTIHQISPFAYLVIQSHFGRPSSVFTVTGNSAIMLQRVKDSIVQVPIPYNHPQWGSNTTASYDRGRFSFDQEHFIDRPHKLDYQPLERSLNYQYTTDFVYCCGIDSAWTFKGSFKLQNDTFRFMNQVKTLYQEPRD